MGYKILIVDDSAIVRRVLNKSIGLSGVEVSEVLEAENGLAALEVLQKKWVDLVFLDINMPVMNGMEFLQKLREEKKLSKTPVIVISTEGSIERQDEMFARDVKDYLRKPVTPEQLANAIRGALE